MSLSEYTLARKKGKADEETLAVLNNSIFSELPKVYIGVLEIPLDLVVGTITSSRATSFTESWMPTLDEDTEFATKWSRLYDAQIEEGIREPIQVYEYMHAFFVKEGNKRVSVLKYLQAPSIMAEITRIMPVHNDSQELQVYEEFLRFQKVTNLYTPYFTIPGSYQLLADMLGQNLETKWPQDLIRTFQGAFYRFELVTKDITSNQPSFNISDAFLIYLSIFTFDSLLDKNRIILRHRIERILKEFNRSESNVSLEYKAKAKSQSILSLLNFRKQYYSERDPLTIAFLYPSNDLNNLQTAVMESGRTYLNNRYEGVLNTTAYTGCSDTKTTEQIIHQACQNHEWIITTSPLLLKDTLKAATDYPDHKFMNHCTPLVSHIINTYALRSYELFFLMGILAGMIHDQRLIGYLPYDNEVSLIELNAFALGVSWTSPDAKVHILKEPCQNAIIMDNRSTTHKPGLYRFRESQEECLAAPIYNWSLFYDLLVQDILTHKEISEQSYWLGLSSGAEELYLPSSTSAAILRTMNHFITAIKEGTIVPFTGPIETRTGKQIVEADSSLQPLDIIRINWLNNNIVGELSSNNIPRDELTEIKTTDENSSHK